MQFQGKSVIITGAGKGIGRATALLMAARGARVVAISRTRSDLDSLARDTGSQGIAADLIATRHGFSRDDVDALARAVSDNTARVYGSF